MDSKYRISHSRESRKVFCTLTISHYLTEPGSDLVLVTRTSISRRSDLVWLTLSSWNILVFSAPVTVLLSVCPGVNIRWSPQPPHCATDTRGGGGSSQPSCVMCTLLCTCAEEERDPDPEAFMNYEFILLFSCSFHFLKLWNCIDLEFREIYENEKSVQPRLGTHYVRDSLRGPPSQKGGQFAEVNQQEGTAGHQTFIYLNLIKKKK